jgi:hypothetical protein
VTESIVDAFFLGSSENTYLEEVDLESLVHDEAGLKRSKRYLVLRLGTTSIASLLDSFENR